MITVKTNIGIVGPKLLQKLAVLRDPAPLLRPVAFDVLTMLTERIHEEGKAADGNPIGEYNSSYLKLRQKKFKRTADKKIIVSQTRQLENDWSVIATPKGWGIGFKNSFNAQKLKWVEEVKNKKIAALTQVEKTYAIQKLQTLVHAELNK